MTGCLRMLVTMACAATPAIVVRPTAVPTVSAVLSMPKPGNRDRCWYIGPLSQNPSSLQPMQPWPDWIGKLVPSFHFTTEQALYVTGPLQPILYRQYPLRAFSSSHDSTNRPAS